MSAARMLIALLVLVGVLSGSSTALADRPERAPVEAGDFATGPGEVCSFPVLFEVVKIKEKFTFFSDGRALITGQLKVRLTNLDNDTSLEFNVSGPGWLADHSGAEIGRGSGILILFAGFDVDGPALLFVHGRFVITRAANGSITNIEAHGRSTDLCAALA